MHRALTMNRIRKCLCPGRRARIGGRHREGGSGGPCRDVETGGRAHERAGGGVGGHERDYRPRLHVGINHGRCRRGAAGKRPERGPVTETARGGGEVINRRLDPIRRAEYLFVSHQGNA